MIPLFTRTIETKPVSAKHSEGLIRITITERSIQSDYEQFVTLDDGNPGILGSRGSSRNPEVVAKEVVEGLNVTFDVVIAALVQHTEKWRLEDEQAIEASRNPPA